MFFYRIIRGQDKSTIFIYTLQKNKRKTTFWWHWEDDFNCCMVGQRMSKKFAVSQRWPKLLLRKWQVTGQWCRVSKNLDSSLNQTRLQRCWYASSATLGPTNEGCTIDDIIESMVNRRKWGCVWDPKLHYIHKSCTGFYPFCVSFFEEYTIFIPLLLINLYENKSIFFVTRHKPGSTYYGSPLA